MTKDESYKRYLPFSRRKYRAMQTLCAILLVLNVLLGTALILTAFRGPEVEYRYIEGPVVPVLETVYVEKEVYPSTPYQAIADSITQEDTDLVAKVLNLEAGNQSMAGKRAVVEVIFNRVLSDRFPDTIREVIFQPLQFSTAGNLSAAVPSQEEYEAIRQVLEGTEPILDRDVLFFSTKGFQGQQTYERIGAHVFCY